MAGRFFIKFCCAPCQESRAKPSWKKKRRLIDSLRCANDVILCTAKTSESGTNLINLTKIVAIKPIPEDNYTVLEIILRKNYKTSFTDINVVYILLLSKSNSVKHNSVRLMTRLQQKKLNNNRALIGFVPVATSSPYSLYSQGVDSELYHLVRDRFKSTFSGSIVSLLCSSQIYYMQILYH